MVVSVKAVGINYPDVLVISGKYQVLPPRPFTPGKDLAGIVKDVGVNVKDFQAGDRVMSQVENGAFAEEAIVRPDQIYVIPDDLPSAPAAAMGLVYQTARSEKSRVGTECFRTCRSGRWSYPEKKKKL